MARMSLTLPRRIELRTSRLTFTPLLKVPAKMPFPPVAVAAPQWARAVGITRRRRGRITEAAAALVAALRSVAPRQAGARGVR